MPDETGFLKAYRASDYRRPSVTADIVLFTISPLRELSILLIQRNSHPYKDRWALPGGFLRAGEESTEGTAARELFEETGIKDIPLRQLYTFSQPGRDPRTHVISVAYTALVPHSRLSFKAGDDAGKAGLFAIRRYDNGLGFDSGRYLLTEQGLAFDHAGIIRMAIGRISGRIDYEPDAFSLLEDPGSFTIHELKTVYEAIKDRKLDAGNFRKMFKRNYLGTGMVKALGISATGRGTKPAALYALDRKE